MESIGEYEERKESEIQNLCITCKRDMGLDNPRQLCGKYQCDYIEYMSEDETEDQNIDDKGLFETKDYLEDNVFDFSFVSVVSIVSFFIVISIYYV